MREPSWEEIGIRIREARLRIALTQEQFAEEIGVNRATISYMELGQRKVTMVELVKMVNSLKINPLYLLIGEYEYNPRDNRT